MGKRKIDARRIKINRNYTTSEAAERLGVHKHSVQLWIKAGLACMNERRPHLILGHDLKEFLNNRRDRARQKCAPGELYCLKCRAPRKPAFGMLDYLPISLVSGNLRGICGTCEKFIYRRVSLLKLNAVTVGCQVAFPQGQKRITGRP